MTKILLALLFLPALAGAQDFKTGDSVTIKKSDRLFLVIAPVRRGEKLTKDYYACHDVRYDRTVVLPKKSLEYYARRKKK